MSQKYTIRYILFNIIPNENKSNDECNFRHSISIRIRLLESEYLVQH